MLRAVFLIPLWAGIFGSQPNKSKSFTEGYGYAIKVGLSPVLGLSALGAVPSHFQFLVLVL